MTEEELEKAQKDQTWLARTTSFTGKTELVKIVHKSGTSTMFPECWGVTTRPPNGDVLLVFPSELRLATPQDFLTLGED